ncbi:ATP-binding cassette domain-containing protein [Leptothrix discophora]|uniref:ABC transporter ATP-binding protein n=1 Tax=Leptothrix discophora TaxID=89 RepID=A0ABT9FZC6_LEPDI|nr:ABC transporter ATP-binding protein [Leptothrix discophora]MDP4299402.1 ABC transporter ATP-binding protein [Leptothrix discophora]
MSTLLLDIAELCVDLDDDAQPRPRRMLHGLSLALRRGETVALVGPSGSGKSLTAAALMRLLPENAWIAAGDVRLAARGGPEAHDGRRAPTQNLPDLPEHAMRPVRGGRIGIVFQDPSASLNPVLTIGRQLREAIEAHTALRGAAAGARARRWLDEVGLPASALDRHAFELSGGQQQRAMLAIALAGEPELLIADEATSALDVLTQAQVLSLIERLQAERRLGLLLITHDLAIAARHADRIALLDHGRLVAAGPTALLLGRDGAPALPLLRELLDAVPGGAGWGRGEAELRPGSTPTPTPTAPLLRVDALRIAYPARRTGLIGREPGHVAVDGVGFELAAGRTLALVGASGCGKSSVALALTRLLPASARLEGSILLDNVDLGGLKGRALRQARCDVQLVFQDPLASLDPRQRVGDMLAETLAALRPDWDAGRRAARLAGLVEQVGLAGLDLGRHPHAYSGGQRQRLAIARALACQPRLLVCDEPTSALDLITQAQVLSLLRDLQRETGVAMVFITHHLALVEAIADEVAVMDAGRIVESGPVDRVLDPVAGQRHPVTRSLWAALPRL